MSSKLCICAFDFELILNTGVIAIPQLMKYFWNQLPYNTRLGQTLITNYGKPTTILCNTRIEHWLVLPFTGANSSDLKWYFAVTMVTAVGLTGCGMGPWLVLVSPCFRENVVATCKIGSFLCSLDNFLQKKRYSLFWKSNFKMALIWKKGYFWPTFRIF